MLLSRILEFCALVEIEIFVGVGPHYSLLVSYLLFQLIMKFWSGERYSVVLPEKLQTGKWNVYRSLIYFSFYSYLLKFLSLIYLLICDCGRSAHSPLKLVDRFPDHPEIGTLHDNFVYGRIFSPLCNLCIHFSPYFESLYCCSCGNHALYETLFLTLFLSFVCSDMHLKHLKTISTWVHVFVLMGVLESKLEFYHIVVIIFTQI